MSPVRVAWAAITLVALGTLSLNASTHLPVEEVDPIIGTAGDGQTTPNVGVPFGMTQWTPATRNGEVRRLAPYYYNDKELVGLRGSHFLSGSGTKDYGSFQLLAGMGKPDVSRGYPSARLDHSLEVSHPYLYEIALPDSGVSASMTGTTRCGLIRFRFNKTGRAWISLQNEALAGDGLLTVDRSSGEITGENKVRRIYAGNGKLAGFSGYTVAQFDHQPTSAGSWIGKAIQMRPKESKFTTSEEGVFLEFEVKAGESIEARIGTSFVSASEARNNLRAEISSWDFSRVEYESRRQWNQQLGKIEIEGNRTDRQIFYTALYHASQLPRIVSDVSGAYPRFASQGQVEKAVGFDYYDDFSLWDTFRALHPLLTILDPKRESDMVRSLILKGQQGGYLPMFPAWNSYTQEMLGDHAVSVIGDAYLKGLRGFDIEAGYALMRQSAMTTPDDLSAYRDGQGRRGLDSYLHYGFIPLEDQVPDAFHRKGQVSRTLEYAYDDFVLSKVAQALGKQSDAAMFAQRGQNFRNVIDPITGYARGRHQSGAWEEPFDPEKSSPAYIESSAAHNALFAPQDISGLIDLEGGPQHFEHRLDDLFLKKQYDQGNEPSHHIAYLYDYVGAASKTQEHVSSIRDTLFRSGPSGLPGNDDAGQMSAWYIFSVLGFYPVTPGTPFYAIGSPKFPKVVLHLTGGKRFTIRAQKASQKNIFIESAILNNKPLKTYLLAHDTIMSGGILNFYMGAEPETKWPTPPESIAAKEKN